MNIYDDMRRPREQRVFPDINFTCNGSLTKWIVVGEGDILGVYQRGGPNRTAIYYHTTTGPTNYRNNATFTTPLPAPATLNEAILVTQYDYPLVTVEI